MMVQVMDVDKQNSCVPAGHEEAVVRGEWAATCAVRSWNGYSGRVVPSIRRRRKRVREQAIHERTEVVIHRRGGRIRDSDSYGNDPVPPRDTSY
jgi:hypothetical protein